MLGNSNAVLKCSWSRNSLIPISQREIFAPLPTPCLTVFVWHCLQNLKPCLGLRVLLFVKCVNELTVLINILWLCFNIIALLHVRMIGNIFIQIMLKDLKWPKWKYLGFWWKISCDITMSAFSCLANIFNHLRSVCYIIWCESNCLVQWKVYQQSPYLLFILSRNQMFRCILLTQTLWSNQLCFSYYLNTNVVVRTDV